jgi:hypothetical protein
MALVLFTMFELRPGLYVSARIILVLWCIKKYWVSDWVSVLFFKFLLV